MLDEFHDLGEHALQRRRESYFFPSDILRLPEAVLAQLVTRTLKEPNNEQLRLLVGTPSGLISQVIDVGIGTESRTLATTDFKERIKKIIEEQKQRGLVVLSDYHVHPRRTVQLYAQMGFSPEEAAILSAGDLNIDYIILQQELQGKKWPRIVGIQVPDQERVVMNAFQVLKPLKSSIKLQEFEIHEPNIPGLRSPNDAGKPRILRRAIVHPEKIIEHLYVRPIPIQIDGPYRSPVTLNHSIK